MKKKLMLVDSSGILHRARHSWVKYDTPILEYFLQDILEICQDIMPNKVVLLNDITKSRYRKELYPDYKGHRKDAQKKMTKKEIKSLELLNQARKDITKFNHIMINGQVNGVEADDILTRLYKQFRDEYEVIGVSIDKDFFSEIPASNMYSHSSKRFRTQEDKHNLSIKQFKMFQVLASDSADFPNLKVKGIGDKTALKLVNKYNSFKEMRAVPIEEIEQVSDRYVKKALKSIKEDSNWEKMKLIYQLVQLFVDDSKFNKAELIQYAELVEEIKAFKKPNKLITDELDDIFFENQAFKCSSLLEEISMYID